MVATRRRQPNRRHQRQQHAARSTQQARTVVPRAPNCAVFYEPSGNNRSCRSLFINYSYYSCVHTTIILSEAGSSPSILQIRSSCSLHRVGFLVRLMRYFSCALPGRTPVVKSGLCLLGALGPDFLKNPPKTFFFKFNLLPFIC